VPEDEIGPRYFSDPEEALRKARPLAPANEREIPGIEPEMWSALREALARQ
jgi:hypothetical protein